MGTGGREAKTSREMARRADGCEEAQQGNGENAAQVAKGARCWLLIKKMVFVSCHEKGSMNDPQVVGPHTPANLRSIWHARQHMSESQKITCHFI